MKKNEIEVGGHYKALVNGKLVTVRVDAYEDCPYGESRGYKGKGYILYHVTNLTTGRHTTFRSAQKFRCRVEPAKVKPGVLKAAERKFLEARGEQIVVEEPAGKPLVEAPDDAPEEQDDRPLPAPNAEEAAEWAHPENAADRLLQEEQAAGPFAQSAESPTATAPVPTTAPTNGISAKLRALAVRSKAPAEVPAVVAGYTPTAEQAEILAVARQEGLKELVICAGAGTGKTSTLKMLEQVLPGRGQYTAFNASLVAEGKSKFRKCRVNTTHSLAFRAVGRQYAHRLNGPRVRGEQLAQQLGIEDLTLQTPWTATKDEKTGEVKGGKKHLAAGFLAGQVMLALRKFCQSADPAVRLEHFRYLDGIDELEQVVDEDGVPTGQTHRGRINNSEVQNYLLPYARRAWEDYADPEGTLPGFTHDCYFKVWQLGRGVDRPAIDADYILLDEAQDLSPVMLSVLQQQAHALVVLVGDESQQIYEWRGAVNAMAAFPDAPRRLLSQSFRFGQAIADVANSVLARLEEKTDLVLKGLESIPSRVAPLAEARCYLYRTNAGAVGRLLAGLAEDKRGHLIGGGADVVAFVRGARDLQGGRKTAHPELCCFDNWKEVEEYSKLDEGEDLRLMVKLIKEFGCDEILQALESMPEEKAADFVTCTAHKSKGREWPTVQLGADFPPANRMADPDVRLLYVALTRAQEQLDVSECPPFLEVKDRDGTTSRPIPVRYTKPMPTVAELVAYRARKAAEKAGEPGIVSAEDKTRIARENAPAGGEVPQGAPANLPEFSWANLGQGWLVRGPAGYAGKAVRVTRKNGTVSNERLGGVVKTLGELCFYDLEG